MRTSKNFCLPLAALPLMVLLVPAPARAGTGPTLTNCPTEPKQGVAIVSGQTYYGANCSLSTTGDADTFTFNAAAGDVWQPTLGLGSPATTNVCLTLYAPGVPQDQIFSACTCYNCNSCCITYAVSTNQTLTEAGLYTILVSETTDAVVTYGVSLERLSPTPPDAIPLVLSQNLTDETIAPTSEDMFTFNGGTTGTYELAASLAPSPSSNVCMNVYQPNGTSALSGGSALCTCYNCNSCCQSTSFSVDLTPSLNGTYFVEMYGAGGDATVSYNLEATCLLGTCPPAKPPCVLTDSPSYDAATGVLTMDFTVATPTAATWEGWLTIANKAESIFSQSLPKTEPPSQVTQTKGGLTASGTVGILSTITTPTQGITCSSFVTINTGT